MVAEAANLQQYQHIVTIRANKRTLVILALAIAFFILTIIGHRDISLGGNLDEEDLFWHSKRRFGLPLCPKEEAGIVSSINSTGNQSEAFENYVNGWGERQSDNGADKRRVFVSLSVCWSANTNLHHKSAFPYRLATRLAVKLWRKKTSYTPIVQVVHSGSGRQMEADLDAFVKGMEEDGAVVRTVPAEGMDCALKSQIVRMLAYRDPAVSPDDLIVMADADAFVVREDIFGGALDDRSKLVWLFQYENSLRHQSTFSMSFVAASSSGWRRLLDGAGSAEELVGAHACQLNLHFRSQWDYDQLILTRAVLKSGVCSLPRQARLWDQVRLDPDTLADLTEAQARASAFKKEMMAMQQKQEEVKSSPRRPKLSELLGGHINRLLFNSDERDEEDGDSTLAQFESDPSSRCFYGFGWQDCNKGRSSVSGGCKWWHFYPSERERDLMRKYRDITS